MKTEIRRFSIMAAAVLFSNCKQAADLVAPFLQEGAPSGYGKTQHALYLNQSVLELDELADLLGNAEGRAALEVAARRLSDDDAEMLAESLTDGSDYPTNERV